jgi:glycosyltransferase involved in cell wall biosynthesis
MHTNNPKVSIIMPVYNGESYLHEAITSILSQSFTDFEFFMIDDGSDDRSWEIMRSFDDPRIRLERNEKNMGLIATLNRGIKLAKGKYIARMDSDDVSLPDRLKMQVHFLDKNPDIGVVGTDYSMIGSDGTPWNPSKFFNVSTEPDLVEWELYFNCYVCHPSIMVRKTVYTHLSGYRDEFIHAEDYDFFLRAVSYTKISNLPHVMYKLRKHESNVTTIYGDIQQKNADIAVQQALYRTLGTSISLDIVRGFRNSSLIIDLEDAITVANLVTDLCNSLIKSKNISFFNRVKVRNDAIRKIYDVYANYTKKNIFFLMTIVRLSFKVNILQSLLILQSILVNRFRRSLDGSAAIAL